jgi:hypothetical protein
MNTKVIGAVIIALMVFGIFGLYRYWETFQEQKEVEQRETAARNISPDQLPGMPAELQASLEAARMQGPRAMQKWLKTYARVVGDPRKAWIELDYCGMIYRDNPREARRIFAEVKARTPSTSPVYPRIQALQKTYE